MYLNKGTSWKKGRRDQNWHHPITLAEPLVTTKGRELLGGLWIPSLKQILQWCGAVIDASLVGLSSKPETRQVSTRGLHYPRFPLNAKADLIYLRSILRADGRQLIPHRFCNLLQGDMTPLRFSLKNAFTSAEFYRIDWNTLVLAFYVCKPAILSKLECLATGLIQARS